MYICMYKEKGKEYYSKEAAPVAPINTLSMMRGMSLISCSHAKH